MDTKGFSLLELMIGTAVSFTVGSVALNSGFNSANVAQEDLEAEKVKKTLMDARNIARFELRCVSVKLNSNSIDITRFDNCGSGPASSVGTSDLTQPVGTQTIQFNPIVTISFASESAGLVFNPQGGINSKDPRMVSVQTKSGRTKQYTIMPAIGTISAR